MINNIHQGVAPPDFNPSNKNNFIGTESGNNPTIDESGINTANGSAPVASLMEKVPLGEVELFDGRNWEESYGDIKEAVPHDLPTPKMKPVKIVIYFDASFACDMVTRQSITGIIVFVNSTPM